MSGKGEKHYSVQTVDAFKKVRPSLAEEVKKWEKAYTVLALSEGIGAYGSKIPLELERTSLDRLKETKPSFIIITGPGGVGKRAIRDHLPPNTSFITNVTSRKKRPTETDGVDYVFCSDVQIEQKILAGEVLPTRTDELGNKYAFPIKEVLKFIQQKKHFFVEIRLDTWLKLKKEYGKKYPEFFNQKYLVVFLLPTAPHILALRTLQRDVSSHQLDLDIDQQKVTDHIMRGLSQHWLLDLSKQEKSLIYVVNDDLERVRDVIKGFIPT